uniref:Uncharacterized protein n=1 Tax=Panagrellus redivivus TaxID=6233 RepID=A0A7E4VPT0_PANRE
MHSLEACASLSSSSINAVAFSSSSDKKGAPAGPVVSRRRAIVHREAGEHGEREGIRPLTIPAVRLSCPLQQPGE